jgi:AcrR family transcriptional regulator
MLEEGYASATSRRVAAKAGVKPALVHYHFPSMDDLFLAVLRDGAETNLQQQRQALADHEPLHALWRLNSTRGARLFMEFMALANHRKAVRSEIASYAVRFGEIEECAVTLAMRSHGVDVEAFPPVVMSMIVTSLARILLMERGLGITRGHADAAAFIERYLERFEMPRNGDAVT